MEPLLLAGMAAALLVLTALIWEGKRVLQPGPESAVSPLTGPWPRLAVLVPVSGAAPGLKERLRALLSQDYPHYQVILATRDRNDPATAVIGSLILQYPRARHVVAGPARSCGQKNQNLLAAVRLAGRAPEILVFCDSNQEAPPGWLKALVTPIVAGQAQVVSGYHQVVAPNLGIAALGHAITVLILYLTKAFSRLNQPWGGATAVPRRLFAELQVDRLWAENVVDDVSLAARLVQAGIPVLTTPGIGLITPMPGETLAGWSQWFTRQWLYLKFCMPLTWLAGGLAIHLLLALVLLAGGRLALASLGLAAAAPAQAGSMFLAGLAALSISLRSLHPRPGPLWKWLLACGATLVMASWCHLQTLFTMEMRWRGIVYRVGWRGRVVEIVSSEQ